ncbi:MAG: SMI1/KNR4 family protein [Saprospiraceae bacterium]|nr:SMI1/KNR4 family protein [Saprospiraceae bacterium]
MGDKSFRLIEYIVDGLLEDDFKAFIKKYAGLSLEEDYFVDSINQKSWIVAAYDDFTNMYELTKEFKEKGWGLKVPFAYDQGGWHFCLSFDHDTYGKVIVNRWTDHPPQEQFLVIANSFDEFINGLKKRPNELL